MHTRKLEMQIRPPPPQIFFPVSFYEIYERGGVIRLKARATIISLHHFGFIALDNKKKNFLNKVNCFFATHTRRAENKLH